MLTGRNPRGSLVRSRVSGAAFLFLTQILAFSSVLLAQPNRVSLTDTLRERERLFRSGEYFRAFDPESGVPRSWSASERLLRSEAAIYAGLRHAAQKELETITAERVNDGYGVTAALRMGQIALKENDYGRARLYLNDAVALNDDGETVLPSVAGEAMFWIGISHLMESGRGGYEQASAALEESLGSYGANPRADDALYFLGQLAEARTEYDLALGRYQNLVDRYPESEYRVPSGIRRTQLLVVLHRYDEAFRQLEESETLWAWHKAGHTETSQRYCEQADFELVLLRGAISIGRKDLPGAERAYLTLLYTLDGAYRRDGMLGLAETYRAAGQIDSSLAIYGRIIEERVDDPPGMAAEYFRAALQLARSQSHEEEGIAARGVLLMIAGDDEHIMSDQARLTLGDHAYRNGDYPNAARLSRTAAEKASNREVRSRAGALLGSSLMELHEYGPAAAAFAAAAHDAADVPEIEMPERRRVMELSLRLQGVALFRNGEYTDAVEAFGAYLKGDPDSAHVPTITWLMGEASYAAGDYPSAIRTMEEVVEKYPASDRVEGALYTAGWAQLQRRDFAAAQAAFARLVKAYPLSPLAAQSQIRRGDCFYLRKEFAKAAEMYAQVPTMTPTEEEASYAAYQKGMATWQAGDSIAARKDFALFVSNNIASPWADDALFMTGLLDYRAGNDEGAIAVMRRLLETYPDSRLHPRAYYTIGDAYYRMQKFDEALAAYSIVTERYPESTYMKDAETGIVFARAAQQKLLDQQQLGVVQVAEVEGRPSYEIELRRAQIFIDANRVEDAEQEYRLFIERYPESRNLPAGFLGLAECSLLRRDTATAIDTLSGLVERFREGNVVPMAALRLTDLYLVAGDTTEAIETLARLRITLPESAAVTTALIRESELLIGTGQAGAARELLRAGAAGLDSVSGHLTRSGARILTMLARLESADGERDSARLRWTRLAAREDSVAVQALLNIGESYLEEGNSEGAMGGYNELLERFAADETARAQGELGLARCYELTEDFEKAALLYEEIIARHKDDRFGKEASRRLGEIRKS